MARNSTFAAYISARVRGMASTLMTRGTLDSFLDKGDLKAISEALLSSPYEVEMAEALTRYEGVEAIEDAVSRNLVNTFARLRRIGRGPYEQWVGIFLARWDLIAVRALLRNQHHELDAETGAESLVPGPSIPQALMHELASQSSMEALVSGLTAWNTKLCGVLAEHLGEYQETRRLGVLEEALDRSYFLGNLRRWSSTRDEDLRFGRMLLKTEIDRINLRILFAPAAADETPEDRIAQVLPRGLLSDDVLRAIASAPSPDRAVTFLENTPYADLTEGIEYYVQTGKFSLLERQFELALFARLRQGSQQLPLGIAVLMRYAWMKYNEVINLRLIAHGIAFQLPRERVAQEMLHV
ncbi:MAG: V-type ATPase subunit [Candidatus Hydrogenedentes bacterium]|nr:V-type ATPase subunit [Candidatus Hydrogenedentota bacterium]